MTGPAGTTGPSGPRTPTIRRMTLVKYGALADTALDLGPGLTVVLGPNEAGKSTALSAMGDLLWGIPRGKAPYTFRFDRPQLRIEAELGEGAAVATGSRTLVRKSAGLVDVTGAAVSNPWGVDGKESRHAWLTTYGLDHDRLREGGRALFESGGDLADLVFRAREGQGLEELLTTLKADADALYRSHRGARSVLVRVALDAYQERREAAERATTRASAVQAAAERLEAARQRVRLAVEEQTRAQSRVNELERDNACFGVAAGLRVALTGMAGLDARGPSLSDLELAEFDAQTAERHTATMSLDELTAEVAEWQGELTALAVDEAVLAHAEEIGRLFAAAEARVQDRERAEDRDRRAASLDVEARQVLSGLVPHPDARTPAQVLAEVDVPADVAADLDAAGERVAGRREEWDDRRADLRRAEGELEQIPAGGAEHDAAPVTRLREVMTTMTAAGAPLAALRASRLQAQVARDRRRTALLAAGVPDPSREAAPPPVVATVKAAETDLREARKAADAARIRLGEAQQRLGEAQQRLTELVGGEEEVPAPEDLPEARRERDGHWVEIRAAWLDGVAPSGAPSELAARYETAVGRSDVLADRLREDADRIAAVRGAESGVTRARDEVASADSAVADADVEASEAAARWESVWVPTGAVAPSLEDRHSVHQSLTEAWQAAQDEAEAVRAQETLTADVAAAAATLRRCLADLGRPRDDVDVDTLVAAGENLLKEIDSGRDARTKRALAEDRVRSEQGLVAAAQRELDEARGQFQAALATAALPATLGTDGWEVRRQQLAEARRLVQEHERLRSESRGLANAWQVFATEVDRLAAELGEEGEPTGVITRLHQLATKAATDRRLAEDLSQRIAGAGAQVAATEQRVADADGRLAALAEGFRTRVAEAGAPATPVGASTELQAAAERARRRAELVAQAADHRRQLVLLAPGSDPDDVARRLAEVDAARLSVDLQQGRQDLERATEQTKHANVALGAVQHEFDTLTKAESAAELQALATEALAEVGNLTERYASLVLQREILSRVAETYVQPHVSPLLVAAGELLLRLTDGAWTGFDAQEEEVGHRTLAVMRSDGKPLGTGALSEGTADQAFLALRLAGIAERQRERTERGEWTVPVVLDDVLVAFDDRRSRSALAVMADAAADMQVIVFTHHEHVAELAEGLGREDVAVVRMPRAA